MCHWKNSELLNYQRVKFLVHSSIRSIPLLFPVPIVLGGASHLANGSQSPVGLMEYPHQKKYWMKYMGYIYILYMAYTCWLYVGYINGLWVICEWMIRSVRPDHQELWYLIGIQADITGLSKWNVPEDHIFAPGAAFCSMENHGKSSRRRFFRPSNQWHTVDGRNPAPPWMVETL